MKTLSKTQGQLLGPRQTKNSFQTPSTNTKQSFSPKTLGQAIDPQHANQGSPHIFFLAILSNRKPHSLLPP